MLLRDDTTEHSCQMQHRPPDGAEITDKNRVGEKWKNPNRHATEAVLPKWKICYLSKFWNISSSSQFAEFIADDETAHTICRSRLMIMCRSVNIFFSQAT